MGVIFVALILYIHNINFMISYQCDLMKYKEDSSETEKATKFIQAKKINIINKSNYQISMESLFTIPGSEKSQWDDIPY